MHNARHFEGHIVKVCTVKKAIEICNQIFAFIVTDIKNHKKGLTAVRAQKYSFTLDIC